VLTPARSRLLPLSRFISLRSATLASPALAERSSHHRTPSLFHCRCQAPHTHRHFSIVSACSSASAFANRCARFGPRSHLGEARVAVFLRGSTMAAWLGSPRLAPPHPSSLPSGPLFVLAIILRSSRAPRWVSRWLAPAGHRAPAPPCHHAHRRPHSLAIAPPLCSPLGVGHRVECGGGRLSARDLTGDEFRCRWPPR
jgi:hypothetical protein